MWCVAPLVEGGRAPTFSQAGPQGAGAKLSDRLPGSQRSFHAVRMKRWPRLSRRWESQLRTPNRRGALAFCVVRGDAGELDREAMGARVGIGEHAAHGFAPARGREGWRDAVLELSEACWRHFALPRFEGASCARPGVRGTTMSRTGRVGRRSALKRLETRRMSGVQNRLVPGGPGPGLCHQGRTGGGRCM